MKPFDVSADRLISHLLAVSRDKQVSILDSCGVGYLGSHLMIAGIVPVDVHRLTGNVQETLSKLGRLLSGRHAAIFTIAYDFGKKFQTPEYSRDDADPSEPDIYIALYDQLVIHDYDRKQSFIAGSRSDFEDLELRSFETEVGNFEEVCIRSDFDREDYLTVVEAVKELIRRGDTYQVNLTQQLSVDLPIGMLPQRVFERLRRDHPAPFAAFLNRGDSHVVSASPERFFKIENGIISASPIKGTRPRGVTRSEDDRMRNELLTSSKDRAENTMIVDLLRNDLGRVCEYGSVEVDRLCEIEEHPTLFHLVSTISGTLKSGWTISEVLRALFPCGSITGAPKIRTMEIIEELEPSPRGLSMGAIGYYIPDSGFEGLQPGFDLSVAIRTMVVRNGAATFNVGGGITIDSDAAAEFDESLLKAKALISALGN